MNTSLVEHSLAAVEERLLSVVESDVETLREASQHIIGSGGKRVRPRLVFLAYLAAGGRNLEELVDLAAAIEMVHTATLVHDDINDHSAFRRGKVAVHARWGRTFALLTGDFLFTKVYELMAPYGRDLNVIMADATVKLVEGETLQAQAAKRGDVDRKTYKSIIARKTASLFESGAQMGGLHAGGTPETVDALRRYGYNLGMVFQLVDDILDVVGDAQELGKPVGLDIQQNRGVVVAENGNGTHSGAATAVAPALPDDDPAKVLMARMFESGALNIARYQAEEMANRARKALAPLPSSEAKNALLDLVDMVIDRTK